MLTALAEFNNGNQVDLWKLKDEDKSLTHVLRWAPWQIGDIAGGGRYVTRFLEITNQRRPEGISPDETPAEAIFFRQDGVRIDFLDVHEIDECLRSEAQILCDHAGSTKFGSWMSVRWLPSGTWMTYLRLSAVLS